MSESVNVKEHMLSLIDALANLSPSRNIISQLTLLLPKDMATVEHSYSELSSPNAKALFEVLGVEFGDVVERAKDSFVALLYEFIHKLFDWLDDEFAYRELSVSAGHVFERRATMDVRSSLAKLMDTYIDSIPNPYAEWAKLVLKKLSGRPDGSKILGFLKMLLQRDSLTVYNSRRPGHQDWDLLKEEARKKLKVNPAELEEIARLIVRVPEASEHLYYEGSSRHRTADIYLEHSEYHLDLITYTRRYDRDYYRSEEVGTYSLRRKRTVKEALMGC